MIEDKTFCQIFNNYFTNVTNNPKCREVGEYQSFGNEKICRLIRENYGGESCSFKSISKYNIIETVKKLPSNNFANSCCKKLASILNNCLKESKYT